MIQHSTSQFMIDQEEKQGRLWDVWLVNLLGCIKCFQMTLMTGPSLALGIVAVLGACRCSGDDWGEVEKIDPAALVGINRYAIYEPEDNIEQLSTEAYFEMLANAGINSLRIFVRERASVWDDLVLEPIEPELGKYNEAHLRELEATFSLAETHHIRIILCLFDHYTFKFYWDQSVYRQFGDKSSAFFSRAARPYQIQRVRTLVERFRGYQSVLAWEPINEINGVNPIYLIRDQDEYLEWFEEIAQLIRGIDPRRPITESLVGDTIDPPLFSSPYLDLVQFHTYRNSTDPEALTAIIADFYRQWAVLQKPLIVGEFASTKDNPQRVEYIQAGLQAAKNNGGAAFLWTHDIDPYGDINPEILQVYRTVYGFP